MKIKKRYVLILVILIIIIFNSVLYIKEYRLSSIEENRLLELVESEDYQIKLYRFINDGTGAEEEIIFNSDDAVTKKYYYDVLYEKDEGSVKTGETHKLLEYLIRSGVYKMGNNLDAKNVYDGATERIIITIGDEVYKVGGYNASEASSKFERALEEFRNLDVVYDKKTRINRIDYDQDGKLEEILLEIEGSYVLRNNFKGKATLKVYNDGRVLDEQLVSEQDVFVYRGYVMDLNNNGIDDIRYRLYESIESISNELVFYSFDGGIIQKYENESKEPIIGIDDLSMFWDDRSGSYIICTFKNGLYQYNNISFVDNNIVVDAIYESEVYISSSEFIQLNYNNNFLKELLLADSTVFNERDLIDYNFITLIEQANMLSTYIHVNGLENELENSTKIINRRIQNMEKFKLLIIEGMMGINIEKMNEHNYNIETFSISLDELLGVFNRNELDYEYLKINQDEEFEVILLQYKDVLISHVFHNERLTDVVLFNVVEDKPWSYTVSDNEVTLSNVSYGKNEKESDTLTLIVLDGKAVVGQDQ